MVKCFCRLKRQGKRGLTYARIRTAEMKYHKCVAVSGVLVVFLYKYLFGVLKRQSYTKRQKKEK